MSTIDPLAQAPPEEITAPDEVQDTELLTAMFDQISNAVAGGQRSDWRMFTPDFTSEGVLPDMEPEPEFGDIDATVTKPILRVTDDALTDDTRDMSPSQLNLLKGGTGTGAGAPGGPIPKGLKPNAVKAAQFVRSLGFTGPMGGIGKRSNKSDHPHGGAIDVMTYSDKETGWQIANAAIARADELGLKYVIFDGKIASPVDGWRWRPYRHPSGKSNPTLNHEDHVHISVRY